MNDDIVARLRLYANASIDGGWASVFRADLNIAADEIERLRACVSEANAYMAEAALAIERLREQLRLANIDNFNATAEAERLRQERDEARREVCAIYADTYGSVGLVAERRGWNCFKE